MVQANDAEGEKGGGSKNKEERHIIRVVFLPPYPPDLNPIEFLWKDLKRYIVKLSQKPRG